jgi:phosphoribosylaminoimidazole carboxylase (NCAIR synthetase)
MCVPDRFGRTGQFLEGSHRSRISGADRQMDLNKATLGVVGGGQLGRMMAYPAHRLGVKLVCLDAAGTKAPCAKICGLVVEGGLKDAEKTKELVSVHHCSVVTTEIEHVNAKALEELEKAGTIVQPSPATIALIQVCSLRYSCCAADAIL